MGWRDLFAFDEEMSYFVGQINRNVGQNPAKSLETLDKGIKLRKDCIVLPSYMCTFASSNKRMHV